jgi:hypothetical protein
MRTRVRTWHVGGAVEEGSSLKDQIRQGEYGLPLIGTSRASGQRGSGWDVVKKIRHSRAGAMDDMG